MRMTDEQIDQRIRETRKIISRSMRLLSEAAVSLSQQITSFENPQGNGYTWEEVDSCYREARHASAVLFALRQVKGEI